MTPTMLLFLPLQTRMAAGLAAARSNNRYYTE